MLTQVDMSALPVLLTVADAVKVSGISRSELYRRLADGSLRRKKIRRSTLVQTQSLIELIERLPE